MIGFSISSHFVTPFWNSFFNYFYLIPFRCTILINSLQQVFLKKHSLRYFTFFWRFQEDSEAPNQDAICLTIGSSELRETTRKLTITGDKVKIVITTLYRRIRCKIGYCCMKRVTHIFILQFLPSSTFISHKGYIERDISINITELRRWYWIAIFMRYD